MKPSDTIHWTLKLIMKSISHSEDKTEEIQFLNTPYWWTDTQGCGVGLADAQLSPSIDITLFWYTNLKNVHLRPQVSLASYILVSLHLHTSHVSHIFTVATLPHYHLAWEFSFIMLCFIQPKQGYTVHTMACLQFTLCQNNT